MRPVGRRRGANRVVLASLVAKRRTGSRFWRVQSAWVGERRAARMAASSPAAAPMSRAAGGRRGQFPSEQAALKVLYLAVRNLEEFRRPNVGIRSSGWKQALQAFTIYFEGRILCRSNTRLIADLRYRRRACGGDGWLAGCCSRSSTCWFAGCSAWPSWCSAVTWREMLSCWRSGTRTRCCAAVPAGSGMSRPAGPGSPRWPRFYPAGAGPKSSP
jgi:hypothetical protein